MMPARLACALLAASIACVGCNTTERAIASERSPTLDAPLRARGARHAIELRTEPAPPRIGELFRVTTRVTDLDGRPVRGARVELDASMPQHQHGMVTRPSHRELGEGRYVTEGMKLHMPGRWRIDVSISEHGERDTIELFVRQPPS